MRLGRTWEKLFLVLSNIGEYSLAWQAGGDSAWKVLAIALFGRFITLTILYMCLN